MNKPKDPEAAETIQTESIEAVDPAAICSASREKLLYLQSDQGHVYTRASAIRWVRPHGTDSYKSWVALGRGGNEPTSPEICINESPEALRHRIEMREASDSLNI